MDRRVVLTAVGRGLIPGRNENNSMRPSKNSQKSSAGKGFVKGHDFSRADKTSNLKLASATEEQLAPTRKLWNQGKWYVFGGKISRLMPLRTAARFSSL